MTKLNLAGAHDMERATDAIHEALERVQSLPGWLHDRPRVRAVLLGLEAEEQRLRWDAREYREGR